MLLMRAGMMEMLKETHVISAKAKGLPDAQVRDRHVARLALIPVVSRFVCELPLVIISCFAIEKVFYWNGLGQFLFEAANKDDYHLVFGILTIVGIVILAAHFLVDLLNLILDPRLRKALRTTEGG
jgi:peptide/nickel transport system permease protein